MKKPRLDSNPLLINGIINRKTKISFQHLDNVSYIIYNKEEEEKHEEALIGQHPSSYCIAMEVRKKVYAHYDCSIMIDVNSNICQCLLHVDVQLNRNSHCS